MNDEFYASLKLVSGEEILAKITSFDEDDEILLVLDNPIIVEIGTNSRQDSLIIRVVPWIKLSTDTMYIINLDDVITMTEIHSKTLIDVHKKYCKDKSNEFNHSNELKITPNMGYVSSVSEARVSLEKLYNN